MLLLAIGVCGQSAENGAPPPATLSSSALVRTCYLTLVKESIVPADPHTVAAAALEAIAVLDPTRHELLPASFGTDATRDSDWLAEAAKNLPPPWPVLDAMARSAQIAHLALFSPLRRQGLRGRGMGQPLSAPGFNTYPQTDGTLVVCDLVKGASAETSGLREGDVLLRVDGHPATRFDLFVIHTLPEDAEVKLEIERRHRPMTIQLRLIHATEDPVESNFLKGDVGYILIRWFAVSKNENRDTAALTLGAIRALAAKGARGLVLDLRSAIGGSGEVEIASALCDGDIIYSVQQPLSSPPRPVKRTGPRLWPDRPIVVLLNEQTISAGEDLALALRELGHAKLVGRTTGGGLTEFTLAPLGGSYGLIFPNGVVLGPVTGVDQDHHALKPDVDITSPTSEEVADGVDRQLEAAMATMR